MVKKKFRLADVGKMNALPYFMMLVGCAGVALIIYWGFLRPFDRGRFFTAAEGPHRAGLSCDVCGRPAAWSWSKRIHFGADGVLRKYFCNRHGADWAEAQFKRARGRIAFEPLLISLLLFFGGAVWLRTELRALRRKK